MKTLNIGTLALKLTAGNPAEARRLAERIASGLDRLSLNGPSLENREVVRVRVDAVPVMSRERLADRIVDQVIRQLERK
jgi:hypothetical protein